MFKSKSLNFRLRASFGALIAILVVTGIITIRLQNVTEEYNSHVNTINLPNAVALGKMDATSREVLKRLLQHTLKGNTEEDLKRIEAAIDENFKEYEDSIKYYESVTFVDGEAELYDKVSSNWKLMKPIIAEMLKVAKSNTPEDQIKFSKMYREDLKAPRDNYTKALETLIKFQIAESEKWSGMAKETSKTSARITTLAMIIGTVFGMLIAYFISSSLTSQLTLLTSSLTEGADTVAKAADNIAHSSEELSSAVNEQAAAIQETTASTEELSAMVKKNQENAAQSNAVSKDSAASATEGKRTIEDMIKAIGDIDKSNQKMMVTVEANNNNISEIIQVIHEISNKTKVINEIVFQTKLLSFNASVEAARAGEQGKGFAVVAEEVGNLAQMSGTAAQEISDMLGSSIAKVESIVNQTKTEVGTLMVEGKSKVEHGIYVAKKCNDVLDTIVTHVNEVDSMVGEITVASEEQSKGISEISRAMGQLDQATQINADSSRQMAASSEELSGQAKKLNELVVDLKHTVEGRLH